MWNFKEACFTLIYVQNTLRNVSRSIKKFSIENFINIFY